MSAHEGSKTDLATTITVDALVHQSDSTDNAHLDTTQPEVVEEANDAPEENKDDDDDADKLRRSHRTRMLTEKGKSLEEDTIRNIKHHFTTSYEKWKSLAMEAKQAFSGPLPNDTLDSIMTKISAAEKDVTTAYVDLRRHITPENQIRRRVDTCVAVSAKILTRAANRKDQDHLSETSSKFTFSASQLSVSVSKPTVRSKHSNLSAAKKQEAAAELAATQATLQMLNVMEQERQQLETMEAENRQRLAQQEAENAARQNALEEKRRQLVRLDAVKKMNAAKARLQVYDQEVDSDDDLLELLEDSKSMQLRSPPKSRRQSVQHVALPQHVSHAQPAMITQAVMGQPAINAQQMTQAAMSQPAASAQQEDSATAIARAIAESINASRLPVPEPSVFSGDPLKYKDWKMAFQTLIGRKSIPVNEKVYYLRKYVGGPAKKAIEGYFLLGTEEAYRSAWDILEERYGSSFVIAKAFRDKLTAWPKIGPRDSVELREFADFLQGCQSAMSQIKGLEVLNDCAENQRILTKLPDWLTASWNRKVIENLEECQQFPSFGQFVKFVTKEAKIACNPVTSLHALKMSDGEKVKTTPKTRSVGAKVLATTSTPEEKSGAKGCVFCEKPNHGIHTCRKFMSKSVAERVKFVQTNKLCFGCMKSGHHSKNCDNKSVCDTCKGRHPTCLHEDRNKDDGKKEQKDDKRKESEKHSKDKERPKEKTEPKRTDETASEATSHRVVQDMNNACTSTVVPVWLSTTSRPESEVLVYALLDNQSDTTFILQEKADTLDTEKVPVQLKLSTLSSKNTIIPSQKLTGLQVRGFYSSKKIPLPVTYSREFIPANLSHIPTPKTARAWSHLEYLAEEIAPLIDCDIGLLIGYNCSQALLPREVVSGKDNEPFAQRTDLGWSIVGCVNPCVDYGDVIGSSHRIVVKEVTPNLHSHANQTSEVRYICRTQVKEVVTPPDVIRVLESDFNERTAEDAHFSQEDLRFITTMEDGIKVKADGHCEMPLPFKEDRPSLPDNRVCADHRLKCLRKRFEKDKQYHKDYIAFMTETISRGDAEKVPAEEMNKSPVWYIPHHGVYHPQKPGKIRVVFDCSAKFQGVSLNDHLLTGPELTNSLVGVLCRFRKGPVAVMCDIERMFHQFHVRAEDQDYLRFLWWDDGDFQSEPSVYRMRVHLFGAASSPGCANYGLKFIAAQGQGRFSEASISFIERNFYVDDGLTSLATADDAIKLVSEARQICSAGKLRIHKFISNSQEVLASIPKEECAETVRHLDLALGEPQLERALGVRWCVVSDQFQFRVVVNERPLSRRGVLSTVASIFDPLGFVAPFILVGKQILQQMCREKIGWDEPLSEELRPKWESWLLDLKNLADIKIQRCYLPASFEEVKKYELHHFSDASVTGYGECTYLRAISASGQIHCSLVMGKSRVAPTKITTVPRLELSAAVVAVRTSDLLRKELDIEDVQEFFWTDSKVVLGYVNNDARRFHVFVANRIQRIKSSTKPEQWSYVASEDNPADHASRGLTAKQLETSNWFTGPKFLWQQLPGRECKVGEIKEDDPELRKAVVCTTKAKEDDSLLVRLEKFSDWSRGVRAIARLKRYVKEHKGVKQRTSESTSLEERKEAELAIIKLVQAEAFSDEIKSLELKKAVTKTKDSKLYKLSPFLDEEGILRVGGRLSQAALHPHVKHPAILPKSSHITALLIKHFHEKVLHQGRGMTMNELRANGWWILGCSRAVSSHIFKCVKCRKYRRSTEEQKMGNLPEDRTEEAPPFTYTGIDCFGPIYVKEGRKEMKRYGLILTCLCSRAIHIEVVDDMTTDAFINALRAFIAIRGNVRQLRCDQGTNFVGARSEFAELMKGMDQERVKTLGCEFVMNPPSASHMGGAWERQIRTIRSVLTAVLDQSAQRLDTSSLRTYLYEVMAIINSRPLTAHLLSDPAGPQPLTPNHILTMKSSIILPPPGDFVKEDVYLRKRWRRVQYLANEFWFRWKKEYLLNLQQRQKWHKIHRNAKINDIVIVKDDNTPRNEWKLAKVTDVHPGEDGCVRKIQLLVGNSALDGQGKRLTKPVYLERPIHKTVTLLEAD